MARLRFSTFLLLPLLALAGCSEFFSFNAFSSLDTVTAPSVTKYEGSGGLALLAEDLSSSAVVDALTADTTGKVADIENYLVNTYLKTPPFTSPDQNQAAILYGDLNLKTTQGENLVNNIATALASGQMGSATIQQLLRAIVPAAALADQTTFTSMIDALRQANVQYLNLGRSLDFDGNGVQVGEGVPAGTVMGDVAQKAAIAFAVEDIFQEVKGKLTAPTDNDVVNQMFYIATGSSLANGAAAALSPDPFTKNSDAYVVDPAYTNLTNIFACAGLAFPPTL